MMLKFLSGLIFAALISIGGTVHAGTVIGDCPSPYLMSPHISGDITSGFCSPGAGLIDVYIGTVKIGEWSSTGWALNVAQTKNTFWSGPTTGSAANPTWRALVGADLPNPSASTLGGIESITSLAHNWVAYVDTSGVPHQSQPAFADVSGTLTNAQLPPGNSVTIASASTVDICASASIGQTIIISGTVTVTSLGSTCPAGSEFIVYTSAAGSFTNSASLIMAGNVNQGTTAGMKMVCGVETTPGTWNCSFPLNTPGIAMSSGGSITASNKVNMGAPVAASTKFTISGCSATTTVGGSWAGKFTSGTTGTCAVTITLNGATGVTAPTGWSCWANDETTTTDVLHPGSSTTTTATLSGTTVSGDIIDFGCVAY